MATYTASAPLSNGQHLSVYFASSQAIGTACPVSTVGTAVSTDSTEFEVASRCRIVDFTTDQTAGMVEIFARGSPTGCMFPTTAKYAVTVPTRLPPIFEFSPGIKYKFVMRTAGAA